MSLTTTGALWLTFGLTLALTAGFGIVMAVWDFGVIDEIYDPAIIREHVIAMSATQRRVHAWTTGTLDVVYPFAYGAFLGGMAMRAFPAKHWLLIPIFICIPADLVEGLSQIFILTGQDHWVAVKAVATPIKLASFITAIAIAVIGLFRLLTKKARSREAPG